MWKPTLSHSHFLCQEFCVISAEFLNSYFLTFLTGESLCVKIPKSTFLTGELLWRSIPKLELKCGMRIAECGKCATGKMRIHSAWIFRILHVRDFLRSAIRILPVPLRERKRWRTNKSRDVAHVFRILGNLEMGQGRFPDSETAQPVSGSWDCPGHFWDCPRAVLRLKPFTIGH